MKLDRTGTFRARVSRTFLRAGEGGKSDQVCIGFEVVGDVGPAVISCWRSLSQKAWDSFVKKDLAALGWDADARDYRFEELDSEDPAVNPCLGAECDIVVVEDEYEGRVSLKVKFINSLGGGSVERMAPAEAKRFASSLRSRLAPKAGRPVSGTEKIPMKGAGYADAASKKRAAATSRPPASPPQDDDADFTDVPF